MNIDELLASARLAEDEVPICLRPDLLTQYKAAMSALDDAEAEHKRSGSLAATGKLTAQAAVDELREQMLAASLTFTLRALPQKRWDELYAEHPPREGNDDDARVRFNRASFYDALVRECIVDPELSADQWATLLAHLSAAQYGQLKSVAMQLNTTDVDVPFLLAVSRDPTSTDPASELPTDSASASSASKAGSRSSSTSTTRPAGSSRRAAKPNGTENSKT